MKLCKLSNILLFIVASAIFMTPSHCFACLSNRVKNVRFERQKTRETVKVFLNKLPEIKYFVLHKPERIVIDLKNVFVPQVNINRETKGTAVKKIRIGQNKKNITRIALDMAKNLSYNFNIKRTRENNNPAIEIIVYPIVHSKQPAVQDISRHATVNKKNTALKIPDISIHEAEKTVVLSDDTATEDLFKTDDLNNKTSDLTMSGILRMRASFQAEKNTAIENNTSFRNRILVKAKYKNMLTVSALSDYLYFGSEDRTDMYNLNLYEAKYHSFNRRFDLSVGKQIIRWGKTDQISPVDTLNPQDLREFIIPEYEERKIPIWMADLKLFTDEFTLEGVFIPFFKRSKINYFKTDWSIFGHLKKEINQSYFNNIKVHKKDPDNETEFGLRLTTTIKNIDMGISFHHTTEDTPFIESFPVKNINVNGTFSSESLNAALATAVLTNENIEVGFKRTNIAGFAFETTLSDFGVRGEAAWQENESFLTSSLTSVRKPTFIYIIGADYTTFGDTYLNLQFLHKHISDYSSKILYFEKNTYTLLGKISRNVLSDYLNASLKYSTNLNNYSCYFSPQLKYTYFTNIECIIGVAAFFGDNDTWLGRFKDNDIFFFNFSYQF